MFCKTHCWLLYYNHAVGSIEFLSYRVSSVLNRDVKQLGKKFMFDSNEETCWNSDQVIWSSWCTFRAVFSSS